MRPSRGQEPKQELLDGVSTAVGRIRRSSLSFLTETRQQISSGRYLFANGQ